MYVRVSIPATYVAVANDSEAAAIRAVVTASGSASTSTVTVVDTTTALRTSATVTKAAALCTATDSNGNTNCTTVSPLANGAAVAPKDLIRYTIVATNTGDAPQNSVYVSDRLPDNTDFVAVSASGNGVNLRYSVDNGQTWTTDAPTALPGRVIWIGVDGNNDGLVDAKDLFTANQSFTVRFDVRIR